MKCQMISKSFLRSVMQRKKQAFDGTYLDHGPESDRSNSGDGDSVVRRALLLSLQGAYI